MNSWTVNSMASSAASTALSGGSHSKASATKACSSSANAAAVGDIWLNFE